MMRTKTGMTMKQMRKGTRFGVAILAAALTPALALAQNTPLGATGERRYFLTPGQVSYAAAAAAATAAGGKLTTVRNAAEHAWLHAALQGHLWQPSEGFWIGLTDTASEGTFVWDSGEPVTFTQWLAGEPNNRGDFGNEDWTAFYPGTNGWNDEIDFNLHRGIIEVCTPWFTLQPPANQFSCSGDVVDLNSAASGVGPLTYRWYRHVRQPGGGYVLTAINDDAWTTGTHTPTLRVQGVALGQTERFSVRVTGACGTTESRTVEVQGSATPTITMQPVSVSQCSAAPATFAVDAVGGNPYPLEYAWQAYDTNTHQWEYLYDLDPSGQFSVSGASSSSLVLTPVGPVGPSVTLRLRCRVFSFYCGDSTSNEATFTVGPNASSAPTITPAGQPASVISRFPWDYVTFEVDATAIGTIDYQWQILTAPNVWADLSYIPNPPTAIPCFPGDSTGFRFAEADSSGGTLSISLTGCIGGVEPAGVLQLPIRCIVSNTCGSVTSNTATLTICSADFNENDSVDVVDLFGFLDAWFAQTGVCTGGCTADFDGDDDLDVDVVDLFGFLDAWFAQNGVCG